MRICHGSLSRGSIISNIVDTSSTGVGVNEGGVMVGVHGEDGTQVPNALINVGTIFTGIFPAGHMTSET